MDYEKKYKEALERARQFSEHPLQEDSSNIVEYIFPELQESKDEKIRKWLISQLKIKSDDTNFDLNIMIDKAIAWLEKQGEQKHINDTDEDIVKAVKDTSILDMVEPKFHEGDWVVDSQGLTHQIERVVENVTTHTFGYDIVGGGYFNNDYESVHLWTIQDAKDGDVLISQSNKPFIYNGNYESSFVGSHCGISVEDKFRISIEKCHWTENKHIHPATKEQCNILFSKMREAGYKWDVKKKELKEIEQKPQRMISAEAKEAMYDRPTDNDMVEALRTEYEKGMAFAKDELGKQSEQKTAWSEDETSIAIKNPDAYKIGFADGEAHAKEEMQSSWSEEDKNFMYDTLSNLTELKDRYGEGYGNVGKCIDWLKSLKARYTYG